MLKDKISKEVVRERLKYPYEIKVRMTERRLSEFITYYGEDGVAVSISGGLDSTAAMHFIHKRYPRVEAVSVLGIECKDNIEMTFYLSCPPLCLGIAHGLNLSCLNQPPP